MKFRSIRNRASVNPWSQWKELVKELWRRLRRPCSDPSYVFLFFVSIGIGAMGIWVAIVEALVAQHHQNPPSTIWVDPRVFSSILTYFAALGSLSCMQVIIVEDKQKNLRALLSFVLFVFLSFVTWAAVSEHYAPGAGKSLLFVVALLAMGSWWIANWDESKFTQHPTTDAMGGHSDDPLAGSTKGYTV